MEGLNSRRGSCEAPNAQLLVRLVSLPTPRCALPSRQGDVKGSAKPVRYIPGVSGMALVDVAAPSPPADASAFKQTLPPIQSKLLKSPTASSSAVLDLANSYLQEAVDVQQRHHRVNSVVYAGELYTPTPPTTAKVNQVGPLIVPATTVGCHEPWPVANAFTVRHSAPARLADIQSGRSAYHRPKLNSSPDGLLRSCDQDAPPSHLPRQLTSTQPTMGDAATHQLVKETKTTNLNKSSSFREVSRSPEGDNFRKDYSRCRPWKRMQSSGVSGPSTPAWDCSRGWEIAQGNEDDLELLVCCSTALQV